MSKTKWERFLVLIMGPAMNLVLAVLVMWLVLYQGAEEPAYEEEPPVVGRVVEDSPAARAGIASGERIVSVAGRAVDTWNALFMEVLPRAEREIPIVVRGVEGRERTLQVTPDAQTSFEMGDLGIGRRCTRRSCRSCRTSRRTGPGLRARDVIEAVDGEGVDHAELIARINASPDVPLTLTVRRAGEPLEVRVTPALRGDIGLTGMTVAPFETRIVEPGFIEAFGMSLERNYEWSGLIFQTLWGC